MTILEEITAYGHKNILCTHKTTIELTKESYVTKKGNCILGIKTSKSCANLNPILKKNIKNENKIKVSIKVDDLTDSFYGFGNKLLTLQDKNDLVFRKSDYICDRTVLISCTKSSSELNRELIKKLKISGIKFYVIFEIDDDN
ncbi:MAG: DUF371 domain-containing protein [Promethearchaeota archaeon]